MVKQPQLRSAGLSQTLHISGADFATTRKCIPKTPLGRRTLVDMLVGFQAPRKPFKLSKGLLSAVSVCNYQGPAEFPAGM